jgi:hypothetical protein
LPEAQILEAFRARRAHAVLSEGWLRQVNKARRLLRFHRVRTGRLDRRRTVPKDQLTAEDIGGPWLDFENDMERAKGIIKKRRNMLRKLADR